MVIVFLTCCMYMNLIVMFGFQFFPPYLRMDFSPTHPLPIHPSPSFSVASVWPLMLFTWSCCHLELSLIWPLPTTMTPPNCTLDRRSFCTSVYFAYVRCLLHLLFKIPLPIFFPHISNELCHPKYIYKLPLYFLVGINSMHSPMSHTSWSFNYFLKTYFPLHSHVLIVKPLKTSLQTSLHNAPPPRPSTTPIHILHRSTTPRHYISQPHPATAPHPSTTPFAPLTIPVPPNRCGILPELREC